MPKYWGKQIFAHGRFPEVSQKQKTERKEREKERLNDGNNNGQATHGPRKHASRTQAAWANNVHSIAYLASYAEFVSVAIQSFSQYRKVNQNKKITYP